MAPGRSCTRNKMQECSSEMNLRPRLQTLVYRTEQSIAWEFLGEMETDDSGLSLSAYFRVLRPEYRRLRQSPGPALRSFRLHLLHTMTCIRVFISSSFCEPERTGILRLTGAQHAAYVHPSSKTTLYTESLAPVRQFMARYFIKGLRA